MSQRRAPPPSASEAMTPPPDAAVARFAGDVVRLLAQAHGHNMCDPLLALAVSGGPDSMAMLALAAAAFPGRVIAATFDHGLRAGSADEAAMVAAACDGLAVPHATLRTDAPITGSSIQMRAREARYVALGAWARGADATALLTAHHADDQAETLLMRLNRASGLPGLAGIRPWRWDHGVAAIRPLLDWRRADLRAIAQGCGMPFVDDPSNDDARHDRTRMRALLAATPGLDVAALAASATYLADAELAVSRLAELLWSERWRGPDRGLSLDDQPRELRRRLLRRAVLETRAAAAIVLPAFSDAANVEPLLDSLERGQGAVQGGVKVTPTRAGWTFAPAPPRRSA